MKIVMWSVVVVLASLSAMTANADTFTIYTSFLQAPEERGVVRVRAFAFNAETPRATAMLDVMNTLRSPIAINGNTYLDIAYDPDAEPLEEYKDRGGVARNVTIDGSEDFIVLVYYRKLEPSQVRKNKRPVGRADSEGFIPTAMSPYVRQGAHPQALPRNPSDPPVSVNQVLYVVVPIPELEEDMKEKCPPKCGCSKPRCRLFFRRRCR